MSRFFHTRTPVSIAVMLMFLPVLPVVVPFARTPTTQRARQGSKPKQRVSHLTTAPCVHCIARKRRLTTHRTITRHTSAHRALLCLTWRVHCCACACVTREIATWNIACERKKLARSISYIHLTTGEGTKFPTGNICSCTAKKACVSPLVWTT